MQEMRKKQQHNIMGASTASNLSSYSNVPTQATNDSFEHKDNAKRTLQHVSAHVNTTYSKQAPEQSDSRRSHLSSKPNTNTNTNLTMKTQMNSLLGHGQERTTHHRYSQSPVRKEYKPANISSSSNTSLHSHQPHQRDSSLTKDSSLLAKSKPIGSFAK